MEKPAQVFSLESVNALVPRLNELVGKQLERRSHIEEKLKELGGLIGEVPESIVLETSDTETVGSLKREVVARIEQYQAGWRELEDMGAVLKDARTGLLDFYGSVEGKMVWLCWKYGETEISYYHNLDEGFASRKELREPMRKRMLN